MNFILTLFFAAFTGFDAYFAIGHFMEGEIGAGVFASIAALWCLLCMVGYFFKEEN